MGSNPAVQMQLVSASSASASSAYSTASWYDDDGLDEDDNGNEDDDGNDNVQSECNQSFGTERVHTAALCGLAGI